MVEEMAKEKRMLIKKSSLGTIFIFLLLLTFILMKDKSMADTKEYSVSERGDGGYTISINYSKRIWKPITAEGFFPKEEGRYEINLIGKGEDWSNQGESGFFYPFDKIESKKSHWEVGFAWVDQSREILYLNLFWVSPPDKLMPMAINGKYRIKGQSQ